MKIRTAFRIDYRTVRAKQQYPNFPAWFNNLIKQGFISLQCTQAAKNDPSIFPRLQAAIKLMGLNPNKIKQYQTLNISSDVAPQIMAKLTGTNNETRLDLLYLDKNCQYIFVLEKEVPDLITLELTPHLTPQQPISLGQIQPVERETTYSKTIPPGGLIIEGTIEKTLHNNGVYLWKRQGTYQAFNPEPRFNVPIGSRLTMLIAHGLATFHDQAQQNVGQIQLLDTEQNPDTGLRIFRLNFYFPWIDTLVGHFYKKIGPSGNLSLGSHKFTFPDLAFQYARLNFTMGEGHLFHVDQQGSAIKQLADFPLARTNRPKKNVVKKDEASSYHGTVQRLVSEGGAFQIGKRLFYIDETFAGKTIAVTINDGEVVALTCQTRTVALSALRTSRLFDKNGKNPINLSVSARTLGKTFAGKTGFWQVPEKHIGKTLFFRGERNQLEPEYQTCFVQLIDGMIVGVRYYNQADARPIQPADKEVLYRRLYVNGKLTLARRADIRTSQLSKTTTDDVIKITHIKIPS